MQQLRLRKIIESVAMTILGYYLRGLMEIVKTKFK